RFDEGRIAIQRGNTAVDLDAYLVSQLFVKDVEFVESFDVVGDKADGNRQNLLDALRRQFAQLRVSRRFQPFDRPDFALQAEMNRAETAKLFRNQSDRLFGFSKIGIAVFDVTLRNAVRAEEQMNTPRIRVGEFFDLFGDLFGQRLDVSLVRVPSRDVMALNPLKSATVFHQRLEVFEGGSGGGNGELRVKRQQNQLVNAVANDLLNRLIGERSPITHPDVDVRFDIASSEFFAQGRRLLLRDSPQWRSAADLRVVAR